ncbi:nuclear mitotic apparatus protein 1 isoform X1 [Gadus chalcogrammus]|uniref:nuclear mitotic apparatus protein 1 isoform X1 n=1 Tax=Gadus chalcogrammus TaxID=1042646 RepID=UPI0024C476DB|nr:nuclear mitotic apparatus protein 1 isoform X1 [Gadus chalcogrammus]XP_056467808.1 nuclear mitotic apparatus protein 1 isoform X1 [Gadus chalcogrammus]
MANVGVEALLTWLNNLELTDQPLHIEDLKDGTYLLKVINTLKNERGLSLDLSVEERFNQIARFLEGDCRLRAGTGATLSRHIANGNNLTVEISKVLLLLVYYDMMNNRSTLNKMELKVEGEIASLTERFVLVTDDYVYLSNGLEAYLGRKYSSSPSTQSSSSLISDDSPVFHRSQKVKFVDLHTVATPAASSRSPLQEVMNTPRFKLRKMQTQMIHEREYKDGLTRELSSLMTQIAQKETEISQLKYQLDKIKENQNVQDQVVSDQINELETKNESLQRRLHELAKQSHDLKSDTIHMERKVDQLTEENGNLSVQVREMRLKLATCEAELERLLENQATVEKELQSQNCHLQAELSQATAKKDFQYEQIEILQGKISSLEEELSRIRLEEKGENMGPVMQRAELENEITDLKDQLEITTGSLREAKQVVQAKEVMLAQYQEDITLHKELLKQQMAKNEKEMQDKQVLLDQTQKEIADQRHILQQEKNNLQLQVDSIGALLKESEEDAKLKEEQMLQKNTRHDTALEQQKTFYQDEMGRLKEEIQQKQELIELLKVRAEKVELLNQEIQTLRNEVETLTSSLKKAEEYLQTQEDLLAKQQLDSLKIQETLQNKITMFQEEVHGLWVEEVALQADVKLAKETIQAKEDMLANLQMESSQQTDILNGKMHVLEGQLKTITTTLSNAKQDLKTQQDVCNLHQQEHAHQLEELQKQMFASEEEIERLVQEIIQKEQQMTEVKKETSAHSEGLQQEINSLMSQVTGVTDSLRKAEEKLQDRETLLTQQEQESAHQKDLLQKQVSACEEELEKMKQEIKTKEEQLTLLGRNGSEQSALLQQQIQGLNSQVESLSSSLKQTEEEVLGQKHQLSKQELESTQQMEALQRLNLVSEENIRLLKEEIQTKETLLNEIRTESSKQSENLANQIQHLTLEMDNNKESLKMASEEVEAKEDVLTNLRQERDQLKTTMEVCEEEKALLKEEILLKEQQLTEVKKETSANSEELQQEINSLMSQVTGVTGSLRKAEEKLQDRETLLTQQEQEGAHQKDLLQKQVSASEVEVEMLKQEIKTKEEQLTLLGLNGSEQSALLQQQIQGLNSQVESLSSSLKQTEDEVLGQKHQLSKQELESTQQMDAFQRLNLVSEENIRLLKEEIQTKETLLNELRTESSKQSENLANQIQHLTLEMDNTKESLKMASEEVEAKEDVLTNLRQERDQLKTTMEVCEEEKALLKEEILLKEQQLTEVKKETSANSEELQQEINSLMSQVTGVTDSLRKAEEKLQDRENLLTKQEQESAHQKELLRKQVSACEEEVEKMKQEIKTKEEQLTLLGLNGSEQSALLQQQIQGLNSQVESLSSSLKQTEDEVLGQKHQLSKQELESTQQMEALQRLNLVSEENIRLLKEEIQTKETLLNEIRTESSKQSVNLANQIQHLTLEMDNTKESLKMASEEVEAKEDVLTNLRQERDQLKTAMEVCEDEKALLKEEILLKEQQVTEVKKETSTNSEELQQEINSLMSQVTCVTNSLRKTQEKLQDRETLLTQQEQKSAHQKDLLQKQVSASEVEVEMLKQEIKLKEEQLTLLGQNGSEQTAFLQQTIEVLTNQVDSHSFSMKEAEKDIQTASDAAKHYKTQMENAMNHYKAKKQLLQESQEQVAEMQCSLDVKEKIGTEFKLLQLDFETVKSNEKNLLSRITSLEAQLAFADGQLREHNKMRRDGGRLQDSYFTETEENWKIQTRELKEKHDSFDSQGDDTLEDSLSTTRRPSAPGESSTPMVRSSERLAGKRRSLSADSLESLYFTPMNNKQTNRTKRHMDSSLTSLAELPDSTLKYLSSSVKRRRTTQVINITMSKKTPRRGGSDNDHHGEDEDTFYSLASARSHPNLSNSHAARPVSMELSGRTAASSDQLMSLPGYRRSTSSNTAPTRSTSTFCVGAENEPENGPDDWMRIAELQSRNKACLPHLKSSYPLESRPSIGPEFVITDDDLRMGDPTDTIRRATLMPGQMLDSLSSHRLSYMVGQTDTAGTRAHRHSLLPGQLPARTHSSSLQKYPLSPEAKASCFPRPLTPKYKNSHMTSSSTQIRTALSPVQRRESTVFTIENTPKKNSYLQKGLNRLRSSTRKSPGKGPKTSPAQRASGRSPGNRAAEVGVAVARRGNTRALPQGAAAAKGQRRSPRTSAKSTAKSPRTSAKSTTNSQLLTSSARKMMSRMKV